MTFYSERPKGPYARTREEDNIVNASRYYKETAWNGSIVDTWTATTSLDVGEYRRTTDVVTPNYYTLIQQGRVINNGYTSIKLSRHHSYTGFKYQKLSGTGSTLRYAESPHWYTEPPSLSQWVRPAGVPLGSLATEAGTQARAGVNTPNVEGLVELAEAKKALGTFRFRIDDIRKYAERMRRARRVADAATQTGKALADTVAGNWMRYRYGIMPLIYLAEDALVGDKVYLERETSRGNAVWTQMTSEETIKNGNYYQDKWLTVENYSVTVRAGVLYRPDWNFNRYGISARELPSAFIELTPYSWVADWFVNISPLIRALTMSIGTKTLATWTSYHEEWAKSTAVTSTWKTQSGYANIQSTTGGNSVGCTKTIRNPGVHTGLAWRHRSVQKLLSGDKRTLDSIALAWQSVQKLMTGK